MFLFLVGTIWMFNHRLVASGTFSCIIRNYTDLDEESLMPESSFDNAHQLSRLYDVIYGSPGAMLASDSVKTLLWLTFAILLNLICITIELQLFQEQIEE